MSMSKLFCRVLETPGMLRACTAFQDGDMCAEYEDGDVAAAQGHLSLLRLRRKLALGDDRPVYAESPCDLSETCEGKVWRDMSFSHRAADWAASQGHLEVVRWLLENREEGCTETAVDDACWNGHKATVRWLLCEFGQAGSSRALDYAASTGRYELVKWLHLWGMPCTVRAMDGAAGGGHLELVQWLAANRRERCTNAAFDMAAAGGHLDVIQWMDTAGLLRCSSAGLDSAAEGGHVHVLQWVLEHKGECQCTTNAYGLAASRGRLKALNWLHETMPALGCPAWAAETAATEGHLSVVKWLHTTGLCKASLAMLDDVAGKGRLDAVIWLHERGARASERAVDLAAEAGHLEVVKFLMEHREEGCSSEAIVGAARRGHLSVIVNLHQSCPQFGGHCLTARAVAEANGHVDVVKWLDERDPGLVQALEEAVDACGIDDNVAIIEGDTLADRADLDHCSDCDAGSDGTGGGNIIGGEGSIGGGWGKGGCGSEGDATDRLLEHECNRRNDKHGSGYEDCWDSEDDGGHHDHHHHHDADADADDHDDDDADDGCSSTVMPGTSTCCSSNKNIPTVEGLGEASLNAVAVAQSGLVWRLTATLVSLLTQVLKWANRE